MRRTTLVSVALLAGLSLAGCSDSTTTPEETATTEATATAEASAEITSCEAYYEGTGTPLAQRAAAARQALTAGEVTDDVAYGEINMLEQRISDLAEEAPEALAGTFEEINAPFAETVELYNAAAAQDPPEGEEAPAFADFSAVDVSGSEAAESELETACTDAGYEVPAS
ncbi:hypothetical protein [Georgenia faecalis]|uniref:hypothetical protein n=1 Tax=Georgenia faecalis TaxID=2483799 RepID=UPI000FD8FEC2|nr:hypothetical protein [Georgenia faecalis]